MKGSGKRAAVVLAAGDGKRLRSSLPKVLHRVAGRPLLGHVIAALEPLGLDRVVAVVSPRIDELRKSDESLDFGSAGFAIQDPPRGTGDAVRVALEELGGAPGTVLVVPGDAPLLRTETLDALFELHRSAGATATLLTADLDDPTGYGRVVRGVGSAVERIVEHGDATEEELALHEMNAGVYVFDGEALASMLPKLDDSNAQGEFYVTDVIGLLRAEGLGVVAYKTDAVETSGVNDRAQLSAAGRFLQERACEDLMAGGVTIVDPQTTYIDPTVVIESDSIILPMTFLEGSTVIRSGAEVGPQTRIIDSEIGPGATVTFSVVRHSTVGPAASVGPYASLRPGTVLEEGVHIGTFVETKKTTIGRGSKAPHLAYLGDAEIGENVNVGAGTITCNWDGVAKHKTVIEDDAYISSDTMLVAPVRIGKGAATGAGSVVRDDVPDGALAVGVPARIIEGKGNRKKKKPSPG
ncbi:MAG: UDP-N-acetylglucosamine diphosphorylase/glucosamine-1-phosphate N-acetyltransferase [Actinobacteria bacterium]|nr:UDP-N-acetylglucosamine diphosphorylase/glucosamine-1-phosphate N-acetyltransferase [Actinomycetota bacterium]